MPKVVSLKACEGCGTRTGVKVLYISSLSQISKRPHPICQECAGDIGPMDDETWAGLESVPDHPPVEAAKAGQDG